MKAVFSSGANRDITNILEYYRREAGADVAADFHSELKAIVDRINTWPGSFPSITETLRRAILRSFPYQVIYRIESAGSIRILVVRHPGGDVMSERRERLKFRCSDRTAIKVIPKARLEGRPRRTYPRLLGRIEQRSKNDQAGDHRNDPPRRV